MQKQSEMCKNNTEQCQQITKFNETTFKKVHKKTKCAKKTPKCSMKNKCAKIAPTFLSNVQKIDFS